MLGIGVSKSNQSEYKKGEEKNDCLDCPAVTAMPYYATVESTKITYADVLSNYQNAVDTITEQVHFFIKITRKMVLDSLCIGCRFLFKQNGNPRLFGLH